MAHHQIDVEMNNRGDVVRPPPTCPMQIVIGSEKWSVLLTEDPLVDQQDRYWYFVVFRSAAGRVGTPRDVLQLGGLDNHGGDELSRNRHVL